MIGLSKVVIALIPEFSLLVAIGKKSMDGALIRDYLKEVIPNNDPKVVRNGSGG